MPRIHLLSIPKIKFAHTFSADEYNNVLSPLEDRIEISYMAKGRTTIKSDNTLKIVTPGMISVNFYNTPYEISCPEPHCHHTVAFQVKYELTDKEDKTLPMLSTHIAPMHNPERIYELIDEIIRVYTIYPEDEIRCAGLFLELLSALNAECHDTYDKRVTGEYRYVRRAKKYIFDHITAPIIQREVAAHLDITPEYLCSVFKRCEGITLISFINKIKLEGIKNMVETTGIPLSRAVAMYGYSDPNYVSRLYRKYYGMSLSDVIAGKNTRKYK